MGNYKVGDRVEAIKDYDCVRKGMKGIIKVIFESGYPKIGVEWDTLTTGHNGNGMGVICAAGKGYYVNETDIRKINAQSIHITANGNTVHAILKDGGKVIKRSKAVCAPSDAFDFETGARIAFDRLCTSLAENSKFSKPQTEDKPKYYSGKVVCVKANKGYWGERLTVGKVYEIDNGAFVYGDGTRSMVAYTDLPNRKERFAHAEFIEFKLDKPAEPINLYCVKSFRSGEFLTKGKTYAIEKDGAVITYDDGWKSYFSISRNNFDGIKIVPNYLVPEVKRPAKVGEWVKIISADRTDDCYENGDILKVISARDYGIDADTKKQHVCNMFNNRRGSYIDNHEYVVLDGYKPEADSSTINIKAAFAEIDKAIKADKCTSCRRERINEAIRAPKLDPNQIMDRIERILEAIRA